MPTAISLRLASSLVALALLTTGCVVRRPPAPGPAALPGTTGGPAVVAIGGAAAADPATGADAPLGATLDAIFGDPALGPILWSIEVRAFDRDAPLYTRNASLLLTPASTMKLVTLAAAADRLGWDHRFETTLSAAGPIRNGVLEGDLVVRGTGDPTINTPGGVNLFLGWAEELRARDVHRIAGRIVGDDDAFDDEPGRSGGAGPGAGWAWDDLARPFAAPTGALQHHENMLVVEVAPGDAPGRPARIALRAPRVAADAPNGVALVNEAVTVGGGDTADILLVRRPDGGALIVTGTIPQDAEPVIRSGAVADPTLFFVQGLRASLRQSTVEVDGEAVDIDQFEPDVRQSLRERLNPLMRHTSEPLSVVARTLMKGSRNLYAESLLHHLGAMANRRGSAVAADVLAGWGIGAEQAVIADGSGLSRYNYLSARTLVDLLVRVWRDPTHREPFAASLPVAGYDGTLVNRMVGTAADGVAMAKTGSMSRVRALAGYVAPPDGDVLVFAILANNFTVPPDQVIGAIDAAVAALAEYARADP